MNPDEFKQVWQSQDAGKSLTINTDVLLQQVERNKKSFEAMIFWRDVREVSASLVMVLVWFWLGTWFELPWMWWLGIPAVLWVAGFMIVDRVRQRRREPQGGEPLRTSIQASLAQVEHQIWLLRNVFWWYLLPPAVAIWMFFVQVTWLLPAQGMEAWLFLTLLLSFVALVDWGIYRLNQQAVLKELVPRRRELQSLFESLDGGDVSAESVPSSLDGQKASFKSLLASVGVIVLICMVAAALVVLIKTITSKLESDGRAVPESAASYPAFGDAAVTNLLVPIRQKYQVPAIAAVLLTSEGITAKGVAGVRKRGTDVPATLDDLWHLGSDGKAMTATLVARLVEEGRLNWDTTVAEVFPELAGEFHPDMKGITVLQLLSHRSGLPPNLNLLSYQGADGKEERLRAVREELAKRPRHSPGSHYEYSNLGYIIVGAIIERVTGKSYEEVMREKVFNPLQMTSAGFGGMGTPGQIDQPWPHAADGMPMPKNGPAMDNPPVMSPAGRIHCTIQDWAKFIADQLRGDRGEPALLKQASYRKLHTPQFGGDYALGWLVVKRSWAGGLALNHGGDNTMNCANVWVAPQRDFAILVCINQSGPTAFQASDEVVGALIRLHSESGK